MESIRPFGSVRIGAITAEELQSAECDLIGMLQFKRFDVQLQDGDDRSIPMTGCFMISTHSGWRRVEAGLWWT